MKEEICPIKIKENIMRVDTGQELTMPLHTLLTDCNFKEHWDNFCKKVYGDDDKKVYNKAYNQKPEVKAHIKAYNQKPEVKAYHKAYMKAYHKAYYQKPEVKARVKAYRERYKLRIKEVKK